MTDEEFMDQFYTGDSDGRLYEVATDFLANDDDWERWHELRVGGWLHDKDNIHQMNGTDPRIGGGITWSRSQREERGTVGGPECDPFNLSYEAIRERAKEASREIARGRTPVETDEILALATSMLLR